MQRHLYWRCEDFSGWEVFYKFKQLMDDFKKEQEAIRNRQQKLEIENRSVQEQRYFREQNRRK